VSEINVYFFFNNTASTKIIALILFIYV
jgi:hypothetical protein